uniref:Uncharacterized protein n=1 Tax=Salmo trutta TaxID=8032 RepID=A0A674DF12_SALTR
TEWKLGLIVRTLGEWEQGGGDRVSPVPRAQVNTSLMLESYIDKVLCGQKGVRFFFPLWESYMGHSVLTYSEEVVPAIPTAKVYKSNIQGQFGGILDRGSLVFCLLFTVCYRYAALIMSLMDKDCRYHLDTFLYNPVLYCPRELW